MDNKQNNSKTPQYLIGPDIFPQYISVQKIVLPLAYIGIVISAIIRSFGGDMTGLEILSMWVGDIFSGVLSAAAVVTIVFAVIEWRGIELPKSEEKPKPEVKREKRFSRSGCIAGIVWSSLLLIFLAAEPQLIAVYTKNTSFPIFDIDTFESLLPIIVVACVLGIIKEVIKLVEGRYTVRLAVGVTIVDIVGASLAAAVLSQPIWNGELLIQLDSIINLSSMPTLERIWDSIGQVILAVVIFGYTVDLISTWFNTFKALKSD